jgi:hypothetical protein
LASLAPFLAVPVVRPGFLHVLARLPWSAHFLASCDPKVHIKGAKLTVGGYDV